MVRSVCRRCQVGRRSLSRIGCGERISQRAAKVAQSNGWRPVKQSSRLPGFFGVVRKNRRHEAAPARCERRGQESLLRSVFFEVHRAKNIAIPAQLSERTGSKERAVVVLLAARWCPAVRAARASRARGRGSSSLEGNRASVQPVQRSSKFRGDLFGRLGNVE
jgi:hypothetical protein